MPYFHCNNCNHEWESTKEDTTCDWCDSKNTYILEAKTVLEEMISEIYNFTKRVRSFSPDEQNK